MHHMMNELGLDDVTRKYWDAYAPTLKLEKTRQQYLKIYKEIMDFTGKPFWKINSKDAAGYYAHYVRLIQEGKFKGSTVLKKFVILSGFADHILTSDNKLPPGETYTQNPFMVYVFHLKKYDQQRKCTIIPLPDIDVLLDAAKPDILTYAAVTLLFRTAIRPSDLCALKIGDFRNNDNGTYIGVLKDKRIRLVFVPEDSVDVLETYAATYGLDLTKNEEPFFRTRQHLPMNVDYLENLVEQLCKKAGTKRYTPYDIRNTSASLMFAYGATENQVAEQLGIQLRHVNRYKSETINQELAVQAGSLVNIQVTRP